MIPWIYRFDPSFDHPLYRSIGMENEKYHKYVLEYHHNGSRWGLDIFATSEEDLRERLTAIQCAEVLGIGHSIVPAGKVDWLTRAICWLHNVLMERLETR